MKKNNIILKIVASCSIILSVVGSWLLGYRLDNKVYGGYSKPEMVSNLNLSLGYFVLFLFLTVIITLLVKILLNQGNSSNNKQS